MGKSKRVVLHRQRRWGNTFTIVDHGGNVVLEWQHRGSDKVHRDRMGQGTSAYWRAMWEGELKFARGRERSLLEW